MKCAGITTIMKMGPAAVVGKNTTITNMVMLKVVADMSTTTNISMAKAVAVGKLILMKNMNMMPAAVKNMSTIITAAVVGKNTITNMVMLNVAVGMSTTTNISMMIAAAADMNIITVTTFRVTRRTADAKSAIRTKNTVTCAAKALKTVPAVCRTLTA